jgi:hypothetical protein
VKNGLLQIKMWFDTAVISANDVAQDTNIDIDKVEGLQHALYFNGKSIAQWAVEGSLGVVTARAGGGFIDESGMGGRPLDHRAQTNNGINFPGRHFCRNQRKLVCAGNPDQSQVLALAAETDKSVFSPFNQLFCEKTVKTADNYGNFHPFRRQISTNLFHTENSLFKLKQEYANFSKKTHFRQ